MDVIVKYKHAYGNHRFYPVSVDAQFLAAFISRKSFTKKQLQTCRENGIRVTIQQDVSIEDVKKIPA